MGTLRKASRPGSVVDVTDYQYIDQEGVVF